MPLDSDARGLQHSQAQDAIGKKKKEKEKEEEEKEKSLSISLRPFGRRRLKKSFTVAISTNQPFSVRYCQEDLPNGVFFQ